MLIVNVTLLNCRGWTYVHTCVRTDGQVITEISPAYRLPFWVLRCPRFARVIATLIGSLSNYDVDVDKTIGVISKQQLCTWSRFLYTFLRLLWHPLQINKKREKKCGANFPDLQPMNESKFIILATFSLPLRHHRCSSSRIMVDYNHASYAG